MRRSPEHAERLRALWTQMSAQAQAEPESGAPAGEDPHAGLSARAQPAAAGRQRVAGTIELAPGVAVPPGAIVFVSVRPAGTAGGPPVAAKRMAAHVVPARV